MSRSVIRERYKMKALLFRVLLGAVLAILLLSTVATVVMASEPEILITVYPLVVPTVTSSPATEIAAISAKLNGEITKTGNKDCHTRGFEWGFSTGNYTLSWNETGSFGISVFSYTANNFTLGQQVFWRAFAINDYGEAHSEERSFITTLLPSAPAYFTITQTGGDSINMTWLMGIGATLTIIRASETGYPSSVTNGYLVYSGNETSVEIDGLNFGTITYYYRAWSWNEYGYSDDYAQAKIGGGSLMVAIFMAIALFLMWMAWRTRNLLICIITSLIWFALSLWVFFSDAGFFDLSEGYVKIFAYVFFIIAFLPLIWSMNQEIRHEAKGQSWVTYGSPPEERGPSSTEVYRERIKRRLRR